MGSFINRQFKLQEVVFELKWKDDKCLEMFNNTGILPSDLNYKMMLGDFYNKIKNEYPRLENNMSIPDDYNNIPYNFRKKESTGSMVVRFGMGTLSVNSIRKAYKWFDFKKEIQNVLEIFNNSHPKPENIKIETTILRYIHSLDINYLNENISNLLQGQFNISKPIEDDFFNDIDFRPKPRKFGIQFAYLGNVPKEELYYNISSGKIDISNNDSMITDFGLISKEFNKLNEFNENSLTWLENSHDLLKKFYKQLTKQELS